MQYKRKNTWHLLHLIITIFFWPWLLIWMFCTLSNNSHNRAMEHREVLDAMERIGYNANKHDWKE